MAQNEIVASINIGDLGIGGGADSTNSYEQEMLMLTREIRNHLQTLGTESKRTSFFGGGSGVSSIKELLISGGIITAAVAATLLAVPYSAAALKDNTDKTTINDTIRTAIKESLPSWLTEDNWDNRNKNAQTDNAKKQEETYAGNTKNMWLIELDSVNQRVYQTKKEILKIEEDGIITDEEKYVLTKNQAQLQKDINEMYDLQNLAKKEGADISAEVNFSAENAIDIYREQSDLINKGVGYIKEQKTATDELTKSQNRYNEALTKMNNLLKKRHNSDSGSGFGRIVPATDEHAGYRVDDSGALSWL
jgi:hypothetical protein